MANKEIIRILLGSEKINPLRICAEPPLRQRQKRPDYSHMNP
jgi:hypothetical protein